MSFKLKLSKKKVQNRSLKKQGSYNKCLLKFVFFFPLDFANDQFSFQNPTLGNKITFCSSKHCIDCDIIQTDVSKVKVGCEIR